ncbi:hypothetical protein ABFX02_06G158300 [Erythranthe guttata]
MEISSFCHFFLLAFLFSVHNHSITAKTSNIDNDRSSLLTLKSLITSDPYNSLTNNWTTKASVCSWIGVTCDSLHNRVIGLDISNMGLVGTIPPEIENLSSLVTLNLGYNRFHGPIPSSVFNMSLLETISVASNSLSGNLPVDICSHGSLGRLVVLDLSYNDFDDEMPSSLGQCSQLEVLSLFANRFDGKVPRGIGNITRLQQLYLGVNNFSGNLPIDICKHNLNALHLNDNMLSGEIPSNLGRCPKLHALYLSFNRFSGSVPREIGNLTRLEDVLLGSNALSGNIPWEIFTTNIRTIDLSNNLLQGSIPLTIGTSRNLVSLNLAGSNISGRIPSTIGNLQYLSLLILHSNKLIGDIPSSICNLTSLQYLHLSRYTLQSINLNGNKFDGKLPQSLVNCGQLEVIDIGNNGIRDVFPYWMETLLKLRVLVLRSNRLNGDILSTSTDKLPFPKLQVLDVSLNQFTGSLPSGYLSNLRAMTVVEGRRIEKGNWFSNYQESIVFVLKGVELPVMRILQTFTTVDLSGNRFSGTIPESIGNLNSLRYLNLSRNNITGNIPSSLGNMSILESLDLSSNQLVGEIPSQLTSLTFLSLLNCSFNNLVGQIPQSSTGQFPTFDNSSYMGNSGLCGSPLTKMCGQNEVRPLLPILPQGDDSGFFDGFGMQSVVLGYGCGFVFGTTIGYFIFRYGRPKWFVGLFFNVQ